MRFSLSKGLSLVLLLALCGGVGWRFRQQAKASERARPSHAPAPIRVVAPAKAPDRVSLSLPGSIRPREHVVLYARTNGFLKQWNVDLGDKVKKGQVLATLSAPEVSANLLQARSRFAQAKASIGLVRSQHQRTENLAKDGTVSPQDLDTSSLRLAAAESELVSSEAEVSRLGALVGFQTVTAPFDGTITKRFLDNGALVSSGNTALFEVASTGDLRVDVDVPQWLATQVTSGTPAQVTIGKESSVYQAEVSRTAGALDPVLRTLGVQLSFKNAPAQVVPGSYARVKFEVPRSEPALLLPGAALSVRNGASMVGVVRPDGALHFVPVRVVRELGKEVEVQGELQPEMKVAIYPSPALVEGDRVTAVEGKP